MGRLYALLDEAFFKKGTGFYEVFHSSMTHSLRTSSQQRGSTFLTESQLSASNHSPDGLASATYLCHDHIVTSKFSGFQNFLGECKLQTPRGTDMIDHQREEKFSIRGVEGEFPVFTELQTTYLLGEEVSATKSYPLKPRVELLTDEQLKLSVDELVSQYFATVQNPK
jgi:hypothetical protein